MKRNLSPPGHSGPRTQEGKRISSLNSTRHGIRSRKLLPCKKERCHFAELCDLFWIEGGQEVIAAIDYGDPCPLEVEQYTFLKGKLDTELDSLGVEDKALSHELAMTMILLNRCDKLTAIEANIIRQVPVKGSSLTRPAPSLAIRYAQELHVKKTRLLERLMGIYSRSPSSDTGL